MADEPDFDFENPSDDDFPNIDCNSVGGDISNTDNDIDNDTGDFEIDMDNDRITPPQPKSVNKSLNKVSSTIEITEKEIEIKKPIRKVTITKRDKPIDSTSNIQSANQPAPDTTKEAPKDTKDTKDTTEKKDTKDTKDTKDKKDEKKADVCLEFNQENIDYYCRDINLARDCCKNSRCINDTGILCLLLKLKRLEYRCYNSKCKTTKTWLNKPIQLLLNRKNKIINDLTPENLELLCPNCYMSIYGINLFSKIITKTIFKCKICNHPLNEYSKTRQKSGYCVKCESKILQSTYTIKQHQYLDELKSIIDEDSTLNTDTFNKTSYFSEVSQFKSFKPNSSSDTAKLAKLAKGNIDEKPIINLNMSVPELADLIDDSDGDADGGDNADGGDGGDN